MRTASLILAITIVLIPLFSEARDPHQVVLFRKDHPCPSTGKITGPCPGWVVDHMRPLCANGADLPQNMAWQDVRQSYIKDNLERELCQCLKGHK